MYIILSTGLHRIHPLKPSTYWHLLVQLLQVQQSQCGGFEAQNGTQVQAEQQISLYRWGQRVSSQLRVPDVAAEYGGCKLEEKVQDPRQQLRKQEKLAGFQTVINNCTWESSSSEDCGDLHPDWLPLGSVKLLGFGCATFCWNGEFHSVSTPKTHLPYVCEHLFRVLWSLRVLLCRTSDSNPEALTLLLTNGPVSRTTLWSSCLCSTVSQRPMHACPNPPEPAASSSVPPLPSLAAMSPAAGPAPIPGCAGSG